MKPLQRITTIKQITKEIEQREWSWDDVYHYLHLYDNSVRYHDEYDSLSLGAYISDQVQSFDDDMIIAIASELSGQIIQNDTFDQTITNADCWREGFYRMFISHLTIDKLSATNLKKHLVKYGVDCFVAHEDIEPSKLWQAEIEKALASMHFLCAIITPDFYQSRWCDQEVGVALGRAIPTLSIKKGAAPHGFIEKYQAINAKSTADEVAKEVFKTLCKMENANQKYFMVLGKLFLNSKNTKEALDWIKVINKIPNFSGDIFEGIYTSFASNSILNDETIIAEFNKLAKKLGKEGVRYSNPTIIDENDLPF